jgi:hypothetical protein
MGGARREDRPNNIRAAIWVPKQQREPHLGARLSPSGLERTVLPARPYPKVDFRRVASFHRSI